MNMVALKQVVTALRLVTSNCEEAKHVNLVSIENLTGCEAIIQPAGLLSYPVSVDIYCRSSPAVVCSRLANLHQLRCESYTLYRALACSDLQCSILRRVRPWILVSCYIIMGLSFKIGSHLSVCPGKRPD